jgi:hypothetical protein
MTSDRETVSPEDRKAFLESGVLELPNAVFSGSMYQDALSRHAVPIVGLLVEIDDAGCERRVPEIARYKSDRGGDDLLYARGYNHALADAITDLGHAAGLRLVVTEGASKTDGEVFQLPERFKERLEILQLPPALRRRVDTRREVTLEELDAQIRKRADFVQRLTKPAGRRRGSPGQQVPEYISPLASAPVASTLAIAVGIDERSAGQDMRRQGFSYEYKKLNHTVSLAPKASPKR